MRNEKFGSLGVVLDAGFQKRQGQVFLGDRKFTDKALGIDPNYAPARDRLPGWLSNYGRLAEAQQFGLGLLKSWLYPHVGAGQELAEQVLAAGGDAFQRLPVPRLQVHGDHALSAEAAEQIALPREKLHVGKVGENLAVHDGLQFANS